jgi:hypothetical protein
VELIGPKIWATSDMKKTLSGISNHPKGENYHPAQEHKIEVLYLKSQKRVRFYMDFFSISIIN